MGRIDSWSASPQSLSVLGNVRGLRENVYLGGRGKGLCVGVAQGGVCTGWLTPGGGAFVSGVYTRGALSSGGTLISVVVQNFSEIRQSAAELQRFNY